jgi:hypothetical protein
MKETVSHHFILSTENIMFARPVAVRTFQSVNLLGAILRSLRVTPCSEKRHPYCLHHAEISD